MVDVLDMKEVCALLFFREFVLTVFSLSPLYYYLLVCLVLRLERGLNYVHFTIAYKIQSWKGNYDVV